MRLPRLGACREIPEPTHSANSPFSTAFATDANSASNFASTSRTEISLAVGTSATPFLLPLTTSPRSPWRALFSPAIFPNDREVDFGHGERPDQRHPVGLNFAPNER